jgi:hypothetical protein
MRLRWWIWSCEVRDGLGLEGLITDWCGDSETEFEGYVLCGYDVGGF